MDIIKAVMAWTVTINMMIAFGFMVGAEIAMAL